MGPLPKGIQLFIYSLLYLVIINYDFIEGVLLNYNKSFPMNPRIPHIDKL